MKKLIILGGSENQLPLIKGAKEIGCYIVLCDYAENNVGRKYADQFYCVSTLDKKAILDVAIQEKIDGIVTNSESAMPICAYVGNELKLPSNPYKSIVTLSQKNLFRKFLRENGFNCPQSYHTDNYKDAVDNVAKFKFPLMVKPVDSSGSRGVIKISSIEELEDAFNIAIGFSKSKHVIIEEFIERTHDYMIGGDIFALNGEVEFWGLMNSMRDFEASEFVPVGTSFPTLVNEQQLNTIKTTINKVLKLLNIEFGPFNLELMFNEHDELYIIEMNPRNGGNNIPEILKDSTGVDIITANIKASLGFNDLDLSYKYKEKHMSTYVLHSRKNGILKYITYDDKIKSNVFQIIMDKNIGEAVEKFSSADKLIGMVFLEFNSLDEMKSKLNNINDLIKVDVE